MQTSNEVLDLFQFQEKENMFSRMNYPDIMRTDRYEYEGNLILEIELSGYEKDDIRAELRDGYLTILAKRPSYVEDEWNKRVYTSRERHIGGCKRSFYVGENVLENEIQAAFKHGILKIAITLPKERIEDHRKLIEIK